LPGEPVPDELYWRFEHVMRGSAASVTAKLEAYRELAQEMRDRHGPGARWLDVGCGEGRFLDLLRDWGWSATGIDRSPHAVEACVARGLDADLATLPQALTDLGAGSVAAISAIQVIEHLPTEDWLPTFRSAQRALRPGGVLLIETIDPRNAEAMQAFYADVTHTWPAHPETLRVMASFVGFDEVEIRGLNPGADGSPQDLALIARKP
jgi:O-antigen chain-terminating methyltransferase